MIEIINSLTIIFFVASVMLLLFKKINQPTLPAYIFTGILTSRFVSSNDMLVLAQIGIAFLVFMLGMSLGDNRIKKMVKENLSLSLLTSVLIAVPSYLVSYFILNLGFYNSVYIGVAASLSSSLIGTEFINEKVGKIIHQQLTKSVNLVQDISAILLFIIISSEPFNIQVISLNVLTGVLVLIAAFRLKNLLPSFIEFVGKTREIYLLISASVLLLFASVTELAGITIVVGAFAAGIGLSKKPYNQEALQTMESLKDFFTAIFFISLGSLLTIPNFNAILLTVMLMVTVMVVKPALTVYFLQKRGYDSRTAYLTSLNLDQISEYALIIVIQAYLLGNIAPEVFNAVIISATVTMVGSSYTSRYADTIYRFIKKHRIIEITDKEFVEERIPEKLKDHFIIGGYDIQGKKIARHFLEEEIPFIVIENNPERVIEAKEDGVFYIHGDMSVSNVWEQASYKDAKLIISTVPLENISDKVLSLDTDADKVVRAKTMEHVEKYLDKCLYVIYPHFLATKQLLEHLKGSLESDSYRNRLEKLTRKELENEE